MKEGRFDTGLRLKKRFKVASGTQRRIFLHPHDPTKLVKVLRPLAKTARRSRLAVWTEQHFPSLRRRWTRKEYEEYLRFMLGNDVSIERPPIAHMFGFVVTSKGLGCLTEAVLENGVLGRTLQDMAKRKDLSDADLALFNDTIRRLYQFDIRAGDMTARNFVFGTRDFGGKQGPRECVLVDGFGDIHAVPVRSWGRTLNRFGLNDSCKRLAQSTGLRWNSATRAFTKPAEWTQ